MSNFIENHTLFNAESALGQWMHQTVDLKGISIKFHRRGNNLHVLLEGDTSPDRLTLLQQLIPALQQTTISTLLPADYPEIYQIHLYVCKTGYTHPIWTTTIYLNQLDRHSEQLQQERQQQERQQEHQAKEITKWQADLHQILLDAPPDPSAQSLSAKSALALSNRSLAKQGQEFAIASYLSEALGDMGVAVRVIVKTIPYVPNSSVYSTDIAAAASLSRRLWVVCEASYSPDPMLVGESVTQKIRELEIEGYRDAVIVFQVAGEDKPDWVLRVDLTPPDEMLREWARWGDVEAIQRLLNQTVADLGIQFSSAVLKEQTLHLFCSRRSKTKSDPTKSDSLSNATQATSKVKDVPDQNLPDQSVPDQNVPDQNQVKTKITPLLETLGPQGIHAVAIYGQIPKQDTPAWVEWLNLPAAMHPALADSALALAQQKDWSAIAFLLHRLLNPDLDKYLATGGVRLQLLPKQDLVHIMSEAVFCPNQREVGYAIARFLKPLKLPNLTGVRIYGRRAGQKHPLWSYGVDFVSRDRIVPEATPEFAASDAYVSELVANPGEQIVRPDVTTTDLQVAWVRGYRRAIYGLHKLLTRSQVFVVDPGSDVSSLALPDQVDRHHRGMPVTLIWGAVGILLTVQANWLLGNAAQQAQSSSQPVTTVLGPAVSPSASNPSTSVVSSTTPVEPDDVSDSPLPDLQLRRSSETDQDAFNTDGFTAPESAESPEDSAVSDSASPQSGTSQSGTSQSGTSQPGALQSEPSRGDANSTPSSPANPLPYTLQNPAVNVSLAESLAAETDFPNFNSRQFNDKLKLYYRVLEEVGPPDVLVVGSSRALRGVDPAALESALAEMGYTDVTVFNFGVNGATAQVVDLLLRQILTPEQLPRLIVWADGARAFNSKAEDVTYNGISASPAYQELAQGILQLPAVNLPAANAAPLANSAPDTKEGINITLTESYQALDRWLSRQLARASQTYEERDRLKHLIQERLTAWLPSSDESNNGSAVLVSNATNLPANYELVDADGFLSLGIQFNPATYYQKYAKVSGAYDRDYSNFQIPGAQENALLALLQHTSAYNVPIVFANLPLTDEYLDPARLEHEQEFRNYMVTLEMQQPGFIFRDMGELWTTTHDYFSDPSHLNRYGAYAVSNRLAQDPLIPWAKAKDKK